MIGPKATSTTGKQNVTKQTEAIEAKSNANDTNEQDVAVKGTKSAKDSIANVTAFKESTMETFDADNTAEIFDYIKTPNWILKIFL